MSDWSRRWAAPAKLNLMLHVVGRRADGYHLLQTVFRLIDLADSLEFAPRADGAIRLARTLPGVDEDADLTVCAARRLQAETGCRAGVTITLEKRIPIGGGLGGGSSDAATTLLALNELWGIKLARERLAAIGLALGADVPFFIFGRSACGEGVGEVLIAVDLPPAWYVVVTPRISVSTREIFAAPELTRDSKPMKIPAFFAGLGRNDLAPVVCARYPEVARALEWLTSRGEARMSGSGASVFAVFESEAQARAVAGSVPAAWRAWAVRGLDRHPLGDAGLVRTGPAAPGSSC